MNQLLLVLLFTISCSAHLLYVGCYAASDVTSALNYTTGINTISDCHATCSGFFYFGMQDGYKCLCLRADPFFIGSATTKLDSSYCSGSPCMADTNLCGSANYVSVFRIAGVTVNRYSRLDCYIDSGSPVLVPQDAGGVSTIDQCSRLCPYPSWKYFAIGIKNGGGTRCYCATKLASTAYVAKNGCTNACSGNSSQNCGGSNALNTFQWQLEKTYGYTGCYSYQYYTGSGSVRKPLLYQDDVKSYTDGLFMSVDRCASICADYPFFAVSNATCYCGDQYPTYYEPESVCSYSCVGDATQTCGGPNALSVYQSTQVFCGDGWVSGIEECDLGQMTESSACRKCRTLAQGWSCKNVDPTRPSQFGFGSPYYSRTTFYLTKDPASQYAACQTLAVPYSDFLAFGQVSSFTSCNCPSRVIWIAYIQPDGRFYIKNSGDDNFFQVQNFTGPGNLRHIAYTNYTDVATDDFMNFVAERSNTGYGFLVHPMCALHLTMSVGLPAVPSSMWNVGELTLDPARTLQTQIYVETTPTLSWTQTATICTPVCGDGIPISPEQCDDGNLNDGDGCSSQCKVEARYSCVAQYKLPFDHIGLTPQQITANPNLYDFMTLSTDSGWYLTLPGSSASAFLLSPWTAQFTLTPIDANDYITRFGIHPALNAADGQIYFGLKAPSASVEGNYAFLTEFSNATSSLPYNCYYKQQWSDYLPPSCVNCGQPTSINTCPAPVPQSLRWTIQFDAVENGWRIYSGVTGNRMVIVYPSYSSYPVENPTADGTPYLALTNNTFYSSLFDIYNQSTTPPTKLYPVVQSICTPICGDGYVTGTETCDDKLTNPNACDNVTCTIKPGWICPYSTALFKSVCAPKCGDGHTVGAEQCDDSFGTDGTLHPAGSFGCTDQCNLKSGWACSNDYVGFTGSNCTPICGNGVLTPPETCDDNNTVNDGTDGCTNCNITFGWRCDGGSPSTCTPICGDGHTVSGLEQCDDGYGKDGLLHPTPRLSGCSDTCSVNSGWNCTNDYSGNAKSVCTSECGNGYVVGLKECDTAGAVNPGCVNCTISNGYMCTYNASIPASDCNAICGDGKRRDPETCDDGGLPATSGDGCSSQCQIEAGWLCQPVIPGNTAGRWYCVAICGDGLVVGNETCDEGAIPGPGCVSCQRTPGWSCQYDSVANKSVCSPLCGDGKVIGTEQCDDGVTPPANGDGCSSTCQIDIGWNCTYDGSKSVCSPICNDYYVVGPETCDSGVGNSNSSAPCFSNCTTKPGWKCDYFATAYPGVRGSTCYPICGDGKLTASEACDDGVIPPSSGDGCSSLCTIEDYWQCNYSVALQRSVCQPICGDYLVVPPETCDDGYTSAGCYQCGVVAGWACPYNGTMSVCAPVCGDGLIVDAEECDDKVRPPSSGDGCSASCKNETGWLCTYDSAVNRSVCTPICGDGVVIPPETCDDGGLNNGNGCMNCVIEVGWSCPYVVSENRSVCTTICGDGLILGQEQCDDKVQPPFSNDGCSESCKNESGWDCAYDSTNMRSVCTSICGDGIVIGSERCDDANGNTGNGCVACQIETGWICPYVVNQSICTPICGDGLIVGTEECDDAIQPPSSGDGCSASCKNETGWICTYDSAVNKSNCATFCGDGKIYGTEQCDDWINTGNGCVGCMVTPGWSCADNGTQSICNPICGDGLVLGSEECDDGTRPPLGGDGCSESCKNETGYVCNYDSVFNRSVCTAICGDGVVVPPETCDDFNTSEGCVACQVMPGWYCPYDFNQSVCNSICGDGLVVGTEQCDDLVLIPASGDGCSDTCQNETGWYCTYNTTYMKSLCTPICGDGVVIPPETCDDGGLNNGNGCMNCQREVGWSCPYIVNMSVCSPICGDGRIIATEECDDGVIPASSGDGCSASCRNESGWTCDYDASARKSVCRPVCGDGKVIGGETCDDFVNTGSGCLNCTKQVGWTCPYVTNRSVCSPICGDGIIVMGVEECDKVIQTLGCDAACNTESGFNCTNYNSSAGTCVAICGDGIMVQGVEECDDGNLNSGDGCNSNCILEPSYVCNSPNTTCTLCYGPWLDNIFNESYAVWSDVLMNLGLPSSYLLTLDFAKCSLCSFGSSLSTRQVDTKPYCTNTTTVFKSCSFPCRGLETYYARESINTLKTELDKGFLAEVLKYFGLTVTYNVFSPQKRSEDQSGVGLNFQFAPCNSSNISQGMAVVNTLSTLIIPNIPNIRFGNSSGCDMEVISVDNSTGQDLVAVYAGIGGGVGALLLLVIIATIIAIYLYKNMDHSDLHLLPKEIRWSYEEWFAEKKHWDFQGGFVDGKKQGYYFKLLRKVKDDEDENDMTNANWKWENHNRVMNMFEYYCCQKGGGEDSPLNPYRVKQITQIYNRDLVTSFISNWRTQNSRITNSPNLFASESWRTVNGAENELEERENVIDFYRNRWDSNPWNRDYVSDPTKSCGIVLAVHGTDLPIARSIAQTGFANLSSLDSGFYGRGIYFSTFSQYVFLYIFSRSNPCIILSWVACGHIYPVIERHDSKLNTLMGLPIKAGFMSHYVKVNACGVPLTVAHDVAYDEIVIPQESQIAPAFILHLDRSNFHEIAVGWDRICQRSVDFEKARNKGRGDELGERMFNPREIPLARDGPDSHVLMDGERFAPPVVVRNLRNLHTPDVQLSNTDGALSASPLVSLNSPPSSLASSTSQPTSPKGPISSTTARATPTDDGVTAVDLKDKTVGVLTGQFVQTKATHISLNPLLLHRGQGKAKAKNQQYDYQRGAETKGEKLPKAYVRKGTYKASQEAAVLLRQDLMLMKHTETFHSAEPHWTLFTEFEEIQYFNFCRLKEEKPDAVPQPIIIGVSPDSLYLCDPAKGNTVKTIPDHLISAVTYENDCSILIEFAYKHPALHIENESIEDLACVLKKMFEIHVADLMKGAAEKEKQFALQGSCTVDERCQLLIGRHTTAVKFVFDKTHLTLVEKSSQMSRKYLWADMKTIHLVLDVDGTLQIFMNDSQSPSFILDQSNGATNILLFHMFHQFHESTRPGHANEKSHVVVEI